MIDGISQCTVGEMSLRFTDRSSPFIGVVVLLWVFSVEHEKRSSSIIVKAISLARRIPWTSQKRSRPTPHRSHTSLPLFVICCLAFPYLWRISALSTFFPRCLYPTFSGGHYLLVCFIRADPIASHFWHFSFAFCSWRFIDHLIILRDFFGSMRHSSRKRRTAHTDKMVKCSWKANFVTEQNYFFVVVRAFPRLPIASIKD